MSLKRQLNFFALGCSAYDDGDAQTALQSLQDMDTNSRIVFNKAMCFHYLLNDCDEALDCFSQSIKMDNCFAAAYFQRGYLLYASGQPKRAAADYSRCARLLLDNEQIDYTQLGLQFKLFAFDVYFNRGICLEAMGMAVEAHSDFKKSAEFAVTKKQRRVANEAIRNKGKSAEMTCIDRSCIFRPRDEFVLNAEKKDYMGKAKVLTGANDVEVYGSLPDLIRKTSIANNKECNCVKPKDNSKHVMKRYNLVNEETSKEMPLSTPISDYHPKKGLLQRTNSLKPTILPRRASIASRSNIIEQTNQNLSNTFPRVAKETKTLKDRSALSLIQKVKVTCHFDETRTMLVDRCIQYETLYTRISTKYAIEQTFRVMFEDENEDLILIENDDDMEIAMKVAEKNNHALHIYCEEFQS